MQEEFKLNTIVCYKFTYKSVSFNSQSINLFYYTKHEKTPHTYNHNYLYQEDLNLDLEVVLNQIQIRRAIYSRRNKTVNVQVTDTQMQGLLKNYDRLWREDSYCHTKVWIHAFIIHLPENLQLWNKQWHDLSTYEYIIFSYNLSIVSE